MPWRRAWQPTPVFWPREFHGQTILAGYSPRGYKELDMTERLSLYTVDELNVPLKMSFVKNEAVREL